MIRVNFQFDKELIAVNVNEVASSDIVYYQTSKGIVYNPQPTPGTVLREEGDESINYFKLLNVWTSNIIKNSLVINEQRLKDLGPSSNTASFVLAREPLYDSQGRRTLTGAIVANQSSATVRIYDGDTLLYTGRLSSSHSWALSDVGNTDLLINLHDVTTVYLKQAFTEKGSHYTSFKGELGELLNEVSLRSGLGWDESVDLEDFTQGVIARIPNGATCEEVLRQALTEHGYIYYSLPNGKLTLQEIDLDPSSEADYTIWASSKDARYEEGDPLLYVKGTSAIQQTTSLNRYKSVEVNYAQLDHSEDILLYENGANGAKLNVSAHNWYDGLLSRERAIGTLPVIQAAEKSTGTLGRTNKFSITVPSGSTWDAICIKFRVSGGGTWGRDTYIAQKSVVTQENTFYDEEGNPYTQEEEIEMYEKVSNNVKIGDSFNGECIYRLSVPCTTPNLYFVTEKHGWGFFANMTTEVLSDAVRWISSMGTEPGEPGETEFQDLDAGRPLWYVGTTYMENTPSTYDSRVTTETNPANRVASTWTPFLVDNTDNASPISLNIKIKGEVWRALSTDEYSAYEASDVSDFVEEIGTVAQIYKTQASYTHNSKEVQNYADRLAKYYGYCNTKYIFYSMDDIELGSIVNIKDNMFSNLNVKVFVYGKTSEYREGSAYKYTAFAIDKIGYTQSRTPLGRPAVVDGRGPQGPQGEQGPQGPQGEQGPQGPAGESEKKIYLEANTSKIGINKRSSSSTVTATITGHVIGLEGTMTLTTDVGTLSPTAVGDGGTATLSISVSTGATQVHVEGIKGAYEANLYLPIEDVTEYNVYSGPLASDPASALFGDFYFNTATNKIRAYDTAWHDLSTTYWSEANISRMCAVAQKDVLSRIPVGSVSSSDYGYFNSIIAGTVTANYIKSQTGVFDNITVTNADIQNTKVAGSLTSGDTIIVNRNASDWVFPTWHTGTIHWEGTEINDAHYYTQDELKWLIDGRFFCFTNFSDDFIGGNTASPLTPYWVTYNPSFNEITIGSPAAATGHDDFNAILKTTWLITDEGYIWLQSNPSSVPTLRIDNCFFFSNPSPSTTDAYTQINNMFPVDGVYSFDEGALVYTGISNTTYIMATEECPVIIEVSRTKISGSIYLDITGFPVISKGNGCYEPDKSGNRMWHSYLNVTPTFAGPAGYKIYLGGSKATVSSDSIIPAEGKVVSLDNGTVNAITSRSQIGAPAAPFGDVWAQRAHVTYRLEATRINSEDTPNIVWGAVFN